MVLNNPILNCVRFRVRIHRIILRVDRSWPSKSKLKQRFAQTLFPSQFYAYVRRVKCSTISGYKLCHKHNRQLSQRGKLLCHNNDNLLTRPPRRLRRPARPFYTRTKSTGPITKRIIKEHGALRKTAVISKETPASYSCLFPLHRQPIWQQETALLSWSIDAKTRSDVDRMLLRSWLELLFFLFLFFFHRQKEGSFRAV